MKKYVFLILGIMLLLVDFRFGWFTYPEFEAFETEAPQTVEMVITHVITNEWQMDIASDVAAYVLLIFAAKWFRETFSQKEKGCNNMKKLIRSCIIAILTRMMFVWMPFFLNGNLRYRGSYLLYFVAIVAEVVVMARAVVGSCAFYETPENHDYNNRTVIIGLVCVATSVFANVLWFYELNFGYQIYITVSIIAAVYYALRIMADSHVQEDLNTFYGVLD